MFLFYYYFGPLSKDKGSSEGGYSQTGMISRTFKTLFLQKFVTLGLRTDSTRNHFTLKCQRRRTQAWPWPPVSRDNPSYEHLRKHHRFRTFVHHFHIREEFSFFFCMHVLCLVFYSPKRLTLKIAVNRERRKKGLSNTIIQYRQ